MNIEERERLMRLAKELGVQELTIADGFSVTFYPTMVMAPPLTPEQEKESRVKESKRIAEENLDYLRLADPLAYEEAITEGELESKEDDD